MRYKSLPNRQQQKPKRQSQEVKLPLLQTHSPYTFQDIHKTSPKSVLFYMQHHSKSTHKLLEVLRHSHIFRKNIKDYENNYQSCVVESRKTKSSSELVDQIQMSLALLRQRVDGFGQSSVSLKKEMQEFSNNVMRETKQLLVQIQFQTQKALRRLKEKSKCERVKVRGIESGLRQFTEYFPSVLKSCIALQSRSHHLQIVLL